MRTGKSIWRAILVLALVVVFAGTALAQDAPRGDREDGDRDEAVERDAGDRGWRGDRGDRRPEEGRRGDRDRGDRGQRERPRRMPPEEMQQRLLDRTQQILGADDEQWEQLAPRLEELMRLSRGTRPGYRFMGRGRIGDEPDDEASRPEEVLAQAISDLREVVRDENATEEQILEKLAAVREARLILNHELQKARAAIIELVTPRQEAILVMMGLLE